MKTVAVRLGPRTYPVWIGARLLSNGAAALVRERGIQGPFFVVTHPRVLRHQGRLLVRFLRNFRGGHVFHSVPDGERAKSGRQYLRLSRRLAQARWNRDQAVMAFGGGVVGDLVGFAASTFKRGLPLVHVPTTLLAQVDSSIGGKTGINLEEGKNLLGTFYQPRCVICDTSVLSSLPDRHFRASLAEVIKYGVIRSKALFGSLESSLALLLHRDPLLLEDMITECVRIKARIVEQDEQERTDVRMLLNFGHTVGHALESLSSYRDILHGEAVALGMRVASGLSERLGFLRITDLARILDLIKRAGLPVKLRRSVSARRALHAIGQDKKRRQGKLRFVLARGIGEAFVTDRIPRRLLAEEIARL